MQGKFTSQEIRNKDGLWIDSSVFREEGIKFMKNRFYCPDPKGSHSYTEYWDEQLRRCQEGYEVGGHKITGHHYSYLNFSEIEIVEEQEDGTVVATKETKCPDFWDGDYDYYWCLEIARNGLFSKSSLAPSTDKEREQWNYFQNRIRKFEFDKQESELRDNEEYQKLKERRNLLSQVVLDRLKLRVKPHLDYLDGGYHFIVGKSRRKGYSFKNADICKNTYNSIRKSVTLIGAFDKKYLYPKGTMGMASNYLSFLNKHTAWGKGREYVDKQEHKRASFKEIIDGKVVESGYMSEIIAITFKDNPDAARGKDAKYVLFEEAGVFPNLRLSYEATRPGLTAGKFITGQILVFGTGGDMESGTVDFAEMFYNPIQFGFMPFVNIWDENAENTYCGFFHPVNLNMEGFYDKQGNSDTEGAKLHELKLREKLIKNSTSSMAIQSRVQEWPLCPSEAFLTVSTNDFPIVELRNQYNKVVRESLHIKFGQPCYLFRDTENDNKITAKPDLENYISPLWDYKPKTKDLKGGVVIYEHPVVNPPRGLYKIGFDPYRQQSSSATLPSLAAIYVYKGHHKFSYKHNTIVAQYVGRPYSPDDVNRIAELLAELYNAEIMHENEVTHVKDYFTRVKKLQLLAAQPDAVISKNINASKTARVYGIHMVDKLKDAGEKYIKQWLLEVRDYDENGSPILNLETIYDPGLLEELILYNRKGNFDRVMAFMMLMFQLQEEDIGKEYGANDVSANAKDLLDLMNKQFRKTGNSFGHN